MNKIYLIIVFFVAVLFNSCTKDETDGMPTLEVGAVGNITKDTSTDSNFDPEALDAMNVKFDVEIVADDPISNVEVSVSYNDGDQVGVFGSFQSKAQSFTVTVDAIKDALDEMVDADFAKGSKFSFYVSKIEMLDGRVFMDKEIDTNKKDDDGEPIILEPVNLTGDFTLASPVFNTQIDYYIACEFDPVVTTGSYHVISNDWGAEGDVEITADSNDPYKIYISGMQDVEGLTTKGNGEPVVVEIDPVSFLVTGSKSVIASDLTDFGMPDYTNYGYEPAAGSLFLSCDGTYDLYFAVTVDQGGWGNYRFTFTRN